jgi:hypothetical protein
MYPALRGEASRSLKIQAICTNSKNSTDLVCLGDESDLFRHMFDFYVECIFSFCLQQGTPIGDRAAAQDAKIAGIEVNSDLV